jgi:hypothetical protein
MAVSENTTSLPKIGAPRRAKFTRRSAIATGLATLSAAAAATAAPALATAPHVDDELIELGRQLDAVSTQLRGLFARSGALYDQLRASPTPFLPAMERQHSDAHFGIPRPGDRQDPNYYTTFDLNELKQLRPTLPNFVALRDARKATPFGTAPHLLYSVERRAFVDHVPWPDAQSRLDEIIAAIEAWRKIEDQRTEHFGIPDMEREEEAVYDEQTELLEAIVVAPAKTAEGLLVKARAIKWLYPDDGEIELGDSTSDRLAESLISDFLAMNEQV